MYCENILVLDPFSTTMTNKMDAQEEFPASPPPPISPTALTVFKSTISDEAPYLLRVLIESQKCSHNYRSEK